MCLGAGALASLLTLVGWLVLLIDPPAAGRAGPGDVVLALAVLPAGFAIFLLAGAPALAAGRGRTVVDGLIVATAVQITAWVGTYSNVACIGLYLYMIDHVGPVRVRQLLDAVGRSGVPESATLI